MTVIPAPLPTDADADADADVAPALPFVLAADAVGMPATGFLSSARPGVRALLRKHGAVLLRGFDLDGVDGFDGVVKAVAGAPLTYAERSSPRSSIKGQVYTSTDYPATEEIFLHNENSYQAIWPLTLFFCCLQPPESMGATPLADIRRVYEAIDPSVRADFLDRGWMVVRNLTEGVGMPWQEVYGTDDRAEVEAMCARSGVELEWVGRAGLRTRARRRAVHTHPVTGEQVWFNHVTFFHVSTLEPEVCAGLRMAFAEEELPTNTYYGDGAPIPDDVIAHLRDCYRGAQRRFDWQVDDVLVVDNMLAAHGREPFTGGRRIAVAMAEPSSNASVG